MKSFQPSFRLIFCFTLFALALGPHNLRAQSVAVTASPTDLSFGISTGTPGTPPTSAAQTVLVNITGGGTVTFSGASIGAVTVYPPGVTSSWPGITSTPGAFAITGNSCGSNTFTAPTTCTVSVTFGSSATNLQVADLQISNSVSNLIVPLSGAYGAIKLFDATDVEPSVSTALFTDLYTFNQANKALGCPTAPTAVLSNTPDGLGNVQVDNYITLAIGNNETPETYTPVTTYLSSDNNSAVYTAPSPVTPPAYPLGNVCYNNNASGLSPIAYSDSYGGNYYPECFSEAYRDMVSSLVGQDTDLFANPNATLHLDAGGVQPLDVHTFFQNQSPFPVSISLVDAGGDYDNSTLFLVTNCNDLGVASGGVVTGVPVTSTNTSTQTQTLTVDSTAGQNISLTLSTAVCVQQGTCAATGVIPGLVDYAIPQSIFKQLTAGTSAAPAVCLRMTGEIGAPDPAMEFGTTMPGQEYYCKGYLLQCYDPVTKTTLGSNCGTTSARNLLITAQFDSPDTPLPAMSNTLTAACAYYLNANFGSTTGTCASSVPTTPSPSPTSLIGPGLLMFADAALTIPYSPTNCVLEGAESGDLCPLNFLTQFKGAADGQPGGSTVPKPNSIIVPVVNMPLPPTTVSSSSINANGWANSGSVTVNLSSNQATYNESLSNPEGNMFTPAPPYSLTYGIAAASVPIPDTTYPVPGDTTNYNTGVVSGYGILPGPTPTYTPICPSIQSIPTSFLTPATFPSLANGIYNLHYFTTACDYSEGLLFNPTANQLSNPTANWASFPVLPFGVDTTAPSLSCVQSPALAVYNSWYNSNVTQTCTASDAISGIATLNSVAQSLTPNSTNNPGYTAFVGTVMQGPTNLPSYTVSTTVPSLGVGSCPTNAQACIAAQTVTDAAGLSTTVGPFSYNIDLQPPAIQGPTLSPSGPNYTVLPLGYTPTTVTITYTCNDGTGSGVASCMGQISPAAVSWLTAPSCAMTTELWTCTASFQATSANVGSYKFTVSSTDNVGNSVPAPPSVSFSIGYASASVLTGSLFLVGAEGSNLTYLAGAIDNSRTSNPTSVYGATITFTFTIPTKTLASGNATAGFWDINCTAANFPGCLVPPKTTSPCSVSPTAVSATTTSLQFSCSVGNLADAATSKTGVGVMVVMPISATAPVGGTITSKEVITAASPLTGTTSSAASVKIIK
jgi:hypothetical protein